MAHIQCDINFIVVLLSAADKDEILHYDQLQETTLIKLDISPGKSIMKCHKSDKIVYRVQTRDLKRIQKTVLKRIRSIQYQ